MKLFFWKDNYRIDSFAKQLADDFCNQVQPDAARVYFGSGEAIASLPATKNNNSGKRSTPNKQVGVERCVNEVALKLAQFKVQEKLGIYGKARVHMSFMERLNELGFGEETVQRLNRTLLLKAP
ncbi:MAG: hypothetical protein R3E61_05265 [Pseudomonadales bacterium]